MEGFGIEFKNGVPTPTAVPRSASETPASGMYLDNGDIVFSDCECIVNAANETLLGGGGVDGAIHYAAGPELLEECITLGGCRPGEAKITKGYQLRASKIIHTVGPRYPCEGHEQILHDCYVHSLELAKEHQIHSVAFPAISTGVFGYPKEQASHIAVAAVAQWLREHPSYPMRVVFVSPDYVNYSYLLQELQALI